MENANKGKRRLKSSVLGCIYDNSGKLCGELSN
jgi:hypothetical protein